MHLPRIPILFGLTVSQTSTLQVAKKPCWMQISARSRSNSRSHRIPYRKTRLSDGKRLVSHNRTSSQTTRQFATWCLCVPLLIPDQEFILFYFRISPNRGLFRAPHSAMSPVRATQTERRGARAGYRSASLFLSSPSARFGRVDLGTRRAPTGFVTGPWLPGSTLQLAFPALFKRARL